MIEHVEVDVEDQHRLLSFRAGGDRLKHRLEMNAELSLGVGINCSNHDLI